MPKRISLGYFTITAYCSCEICVEQYHDPDNPRTASGTVPRPKWTIAADISVLPFGTEVYVSGLGYRTVEDVGGAVRGNVIDVFKPSHSDALNWGRQHREVFAYR